MTICDQKRPLWCECGTARPKLNHFGILQNYMTCLGCKWSHVQIVSRRPLLTIEITDNLSMNAAKTAAYYFINIGHYLWVLVGSIAVNCGSAVGPIVPSLKSLYIVIITENFSGATHG